MLDDKTMLCSSLRNSYEGKQYRGDSLWHTFYSVLDHLVFKQTDVKTTQWFLCHMNCISVAYCIPAQDTTIRSSWTVTRFHIRFRKYSKKKEIHKVLFFLHKLKRKQCLSAEAFTMNENKNISNVNFITVYLLSFNTNPPCRIHYSWFCLPTCR